MIDDTTYNQIDRILGKVIAHDGRLPANERAAIHTKITNCGFTHEEIHDWQVRKMVELQIMLEHAERRQQLAESYASKCSYIVVALLIANLISAWIQFILP